MMKKKKNRLQTQSADYEILTHWEKIKIDRLLQQKAAQHLDLVDYS